MVNVLRKSEASIDRGSEGEGDGEGEGEGEDPLSKLS
jgi:hypothetical protein